MLETTEILLLLAPILTYVATWLLKRITPLISGNVTILVVTALSMLSTYVADLLVEDVSWTAHFLAGAAAIIIDQIKKGLTSEKV